jgi:GTP-binding protein HflX
MVFNKIDDFSYEKKDEDDLTPSTKKIFLWKNGKNMDGKIQISDGFHFCFTKENFPEMKKMIYDEVMKIHISDSRTTISFSNISITMRKKVQKDHEDQ